MLLAYSPDKRHYAYDGPKISCTETYACCYTDTIPGTSFGKKLTATIASYKNESVSVKGMTRLIRDVFGTHLSAGAVSNCTSAKVNHMKGSAGNPLKNSHP